MREKIMNEELKVAIELVQRHQDWRRGAEIEMENPKELGVSIDTVIEAARELLQLKDGTHPDMVMVPKEPTYEMLMEFSMGCGGSYDQMKQNWPRMIVAALKGNV